MIYTFFISNMFVNILLKYYYTSCVYSMQVRKLAYSDYEQYISLISDFRPTTFTYDQFRQTLDTIYKSSVIYVIELNNILVATATIQYEHKFIFNLCTLAHIEDVCVKKEYRTQGLGKRIVQYCVNAAKDAGAYKITLDCAESNILFYKKCGFETRGTQMTILLKDPSH